MRYALPALPFLFICISQVASIRSGITLASVLQNGERRLHTSRFPGDSADSRERGPVFQRRASAPDARVDTLDRMFVLLPPEVQRRHIRRRLIALALLFSVLSSLAVVPHSLSYFNELSGGPLNGPAHLLGANVDWSQDMIFLKEWYDIHSDYRPLYLSSFCRISPIALTSGGKGRVADYTSIIGSTNGTDSAVGTSLGWLAVSVNDLYAYRHRYAETNQYGWLRDVPPSAHVGYSIRIYRVNVRARGAK